MGQSGGARRTSTTHLVHARRRNHVRRRARRRSRARLHRQPTFASPAATPTRHGYAHRRGRLRRQPASDTPVDAALDAAVPASTAAHASATNSLPTLRPPLSPTSLRHDRRRARLCSRARLRRQPAFASPAAAAPTASAPTRLRLRHARSRRTRHHRARRRRRSRARLRSNPPSRKPPLPTTLRRDLPEKAGLCRSVGSRRRCLLIQSLNYDQRLTNDAEPAEPAERPSSGGQSVSWGNDSQNSGIHCKNHILPRAGRPSFAIANLRGRSRNDLFWNSKKVIK